MYGNEYIKKMNGEYPVKYTFWQKVKTLAGWVAWKLFELQNR